MAAMNYLTQCTFDFGALAQAPKILARMGVKRPFVVTDPGLKANGILDKLLAALGAPPAAIYADTPANPTEPACREAAALYRQSEADGLVALGGGASMDLAKIVGLMTTHEAPYDRYGASERGTRFIKPIPPLLAIPTTAGTGSEVSVGAVVILDSGRKETFISPFLIPTQALCDPELTLGLPPSLTAATGMDAVTHCFEAVLSPMVHPPAEAIGLDGVERAIASGALERAVKDGSDRDARWQMMMASFEGALAFVKGLGAVHGLSHALGRLSDLKLHHGTLNAIILPHALAMIGDAQAEKFARLRRAMGVAPNTDLAEYILALNARIGLPKSLSAIGVNEAHWPLAEAYAVSDLATATNAVPFDAAKYEELFRRAL
ncbi:MAG: iron-containing alcohol dehydrogenase [Hyphomonadaceae bacterium]|nr:iron-containing alcohol dehydrogenase [Hyphomonadaceae bacterium]